MGLDLVFHFDDVLHDVQEVEVDLGQFVDVFQAIAPSKGFSDVEETVVLSMGELVVHFSFGLVRQVSAIQVLFVNFQRVDGLLQGFFSISAQRHDFTGGLHLRSKVPVSLDELVKWPARNLGHDVV